MRKDISGGGFQKFRKKDEKRRFRRSKVKVQKIRKMMRKDVSGGQRSKFKKSKKKDERRRFRSWRGKISKNPKK
jgi:hypothetical protein